MKYQERSGWSVFEASNVVLFGEFQGGFFWGGYLVQYINGQMEWVG